MDNYWVPNTILEDNSQIFDLLQEFNLGNIRLTVDSAMSDTDDADYTDEKMDVCTFSEISDDMCVDEYMDPNAVWNIDRDIKIDNDFVGPNADAFWSTPPIIAKAFIQSKPTQEIIVEKEGLLEFQKGKANKKEEGDIKGCNPFAKPRSIKKALKLSKSTKKIIIKNINYQFESTKILIFEDNKLLGSFPIKRAKFIYFIRNMSKIIMNIDPNIHSKIEHAYHHINSIRRTCKLPFYRINITRVLKIVKKTTKGGMKWEEPVLTCQNIEF